MFKPVKTPGIFVLVSGCALLLCACGGGSENLQPSPLPAAITAHADFPESVYAGATVTFNVSLTSSDQSGGTANVQLVDVGTVTPQIDCGQPQTLAVDGNGGTFTCRTPQASPGSDNIHQLQIYVNDEPNLPAPVAVKVVNGGQVRAQLTSASGTVIQAAGVGQTFYVSFSTTTKERVAAGRYTVTAPDGWSLGNDGVCDINAQNSSCRVPVTVASNAESTFYGIKLDAAEDSSLLSPFLLPLFVGAVRSAGAHLAADGPGFKERYSPLPTYVAQNISETLYSGPEFTYKPVFIFKNTSKDTLHISTVTATGLTGVKYGCKVEKPLKNADYTLDSTVACDLPPSALYAVSGLLDKTTTASTVASALSALPLEITIKDGSRTLQDLQMTVTLVPYVSGHLAVRVIALKNPARVWLAVNYGKHMTHFSGDPLVGTVSNETSTKHFKDNQVELPANGLFYIPHGKSGDMRFTQTPGGFTTETVPSVSASLTPPIFLLMEMTYFSNEELYIDQSYVNAIGVMAAFNVMGSAAPLNLYTQSTVHGIGYVFFNLPESQQKIFEAMKKQFEQQKSDVWHYVPDRGVQNYVREEKGTITNILAPISVEGIIISHDGKSYSLDPMMNKHYYRDYINSLWEYMKAHPIYVNAQFVIGTNGASPTDCVLKGTVGSADTLTFTKYSGTCPETDKYGVSYKNLVIHKFEACDFLQAAGNAGCHTGPDGQEGLFGPNGSYRIAVGEVLASYQAAGLLPLCANPKQVMSKAHAQSIMAKHGGFKNPACIGLSSAAPVWNVYAEVLSDYSNVYAYSYGDFLGLDGTANFDPATLSAPLKSELHGVAQPVTITMY